MPGTVLKTLHMLVHFILTRSLLLWCSPTCLFLLSLLGLWVIVVQSLSPVWLSATAERQASLSLTVSQSLLKLMSIESMRPCNHLILCHSLLFLPSIFPCIRVFSSELALPIRWPKYWSFSICPSNEYSRLISFRIDWFDLLGCYIFSKNLWDRDHHYYFYFADEKTETQNN